jgi:hypothetical protein
MSWSASPLFWFSTGYVSFFVVKWLIRHFDSWADQKPEWMSDDEWIASRPDLFALEDVIEAQKRLKK